MLFALRVLHLRLLLYCKGPTAATRAPIERGAAVGARQWVAARGVQLYGCPRVVD